MAGKRRFGRVRRLPSGRFQARYLGPDGKDWPAPDTFSTKTAAEVWLTRKEVEIRDGEWIDPDLGKATFTVYADGWVRDRMLKPRTEELYRGLLRNHIWIKALDGAGLPGLHLHDLRHTGNTMAAATGASLRELMERMGHTSTRAALIYQHATRERDEAIAAAMGDALATVRRKGPTRSRSHVSGTAGLS